MKHLRIILCLIAAIYCFNFSAYAQSFTGSIVGTVKNPDGAVVPNAEITIIHDETTPITILKMKELYAKMERTIDKCEDVANILEAIVLKNA